MLPIQCQLSKSTSCSSLRAPTRNPFNIGEVLRIPGQARDDGRWTIFLNLLTLVSDSIKQLSRANNTKVLTKLSGFEVYRHIVPVIFVKGLPNTLQ